MQPVGRTVRAAAVAAAVALFSTTACGGATERDLDPDQVDSVELPELGACRMLTPEDVAEPSNATRIVDCAEPHTAETYAVGELPERLVEESYDSSRLGNFAYRRCSEAFEEFLGADESAVMRSMLSWAWFRPSEKAWEAGARWYRCDAVGGGDQSVEFVELPETAKGLLRPPPPDEWMACAVGPTVEGSVKVPCSADHDWRAVTTIRLGRDDDEYPGDALVEVRTRDFCSESVGAWMNYPLDFEYGYTWFHEAQWRVGNRRSVCWAKTSQ
ncbi:septum formation family protein [Nocardioides limicola]|uniref:septum formation family protein n=1 Tax=Nocardioides limicola TaxID=2803368 RepID=UPI0027DDEACC|nr:septum formation family protein [Nocardioides sp. DJM-14]